MRSKCGKAYVIAAALAAFAIMLGGRATAATLVVDANSEVDCLGGAPDSSTIGGAIALASEGDTIKVCDGTYSEAVTIDVSGLTVEAVNPLGAEILAPQVLTESDAIVEITGADNVTLSGFEISGPGPGDCGSIEAAVIVHGQASATITGNEIVHARDNPLNGCQNGYGIQIGEDNDSPPTINEEFSDPGTAVISNNTISDYQKGGILVDGEGSSATISGNIVTGAGKTKVIAQNGIEITETSLESEITGNTVTGNFHNNSGARQACPSGNPTGQCVATGTGVLEYLAGRHGDQ
ncbi:MAG TPA: right-handed parallel beta-helix repeat-containing protein, partial [Candidatus Binataceae bacterium]|nr:right-handed parallel beta-helix repeat-containing protein [Candidatus Binataceae bacterium]